jgi:hypothetical protein
MEKSLSELSGSTAASDSMAVPAGQPVDKAQAGNAASGTAATTGGNGSKGNKPSRGQRRRMRNVARWDQDRNS